jgi:hypothetical protein
LNAVEDQFFDAHLNSTLVKFTQIIEEIFEEGVSTADLVFETIDLLEQEQKMFGIISAGTVQTHVFMQVCVLTPIYL